MLTVHNNPGQQVHTSQGVQALLAKYDMTQHKYIAVDAEWHQPDIGKTSVFLTAQATWFDDEYKPIMTLVLWNRDYPLPSTEDIAKAEQGINQVITQALTELGKYDTPSGIPYVSDASHSHRLVVIPTDVQCVGMTDFVDLHKRVELSLFHSPKDVEAFITPTVWRSIITSKGNPVSKKRNLTGVFKLDTGEEITLVDWVGSFNSSLDDALKGVGIDNPFKSLADTGTNKGGTKRSKDRMDLFMHDSPYEFLLYSALDSCVLLPAGLIHIGQLNQIIEESLPGVTGFEFEEFSRSSGALVSKTFERWMMTRYAGIHKAALMLTDSNDNRKWNDIKAVRRGLEAGTITLEEGHKKLRRKGIINGLGLASIPGWGLRTNNTGVFLAQVQGGRAVCEAPHTNIYDNRLIDVLDSDLKSCYGSALARFKFPLGLPYILEYGLDDTPMTLGAVLRQLKWGKTDTELVDDLYVIDVSGSLSFEQDLIFSRYGMTTQTILAQLFSFDFEHETDTTDIGGREIEYAHISGDLVLTTQEIEHGILTSRVLEVVRAVASDREWNELMNLKVNAVGMYREQDYVPHDEFINIMHDSEKRGLKNAIGDSRKPYWTCVGIDGFVGNFLKTRKSLKSQSVSKGDKNDLLQQKVKLFVNTLYGVLAAPYFPIGNTILANNITANARVDAWMMSKALLTRQTATDGGMASFSEVAYIQGSKKPGLHVMANRTRYLKHRSIKVKPISIAKDFRKLADEATNSEDMTVKGNAQATIDNAVLDHVNTFWSHYGLKLSYVIEVKYENTGERAVYLPAADYYITGTVGVQKDGSHSVMKVRGAKQDEHPKKQFMRHLMEPDKYPVPQPYFEYTQLYSFNEFVAKPDPELMPGDNQARSTIHRPHRLGFLYPTYADKKREDERVHKQETRDNKRFKDTGIAPYFGQAKDIIEGKIKPSHN